MLELQDIEVTGFQLGKLFNPSVSRRQSEPAHSGGRNQEAVAWIARSVIRRNGRGLDSDLEIDWEGSRADAPDSVLEPLVCREVQQIWPLRWVGLESRHSGFPGCNGRNEKGPGGFGVPDFQLRIICLRFTRKQPDERMRIQQQPRH